MTISNENKGFFKKVIIIAIPLIIQNFLASAINITDTFMIGSLGEANITAVALANQVFFMYILVVFGVNSGASVLMGQFWGAKEKVNIHKTMGISFSLSMFFSFIFVMLALIMPDKILGLYNKDPEVLRIGASYLRIACFTYPMFAFILVFNSANSSSENTKFPMYATLVAFICNCSLNYIFIYKLNMGARGAAMGTLLARTVEAIFVIFTAKKYHLPSLGKFKDYFSFDKDIFTVFVKKASPVLLNEVLWAVGVTIYVMYYGKVGSGVGAQASVQIANSVSQLFQVITFGVGSSAGIILGNLLGSNQIDKAILYRKKFTITCFFLGLIMSGLLILAMPFIISVFNVSPDVRINAERILIVSAIIFNFKIYNYLGIVGVLRCGGDTLFAAFIDIAAVWLVGVPCTILGVHFGLPIYLVVLCSSMEEVVKFFIVMFRVRTNKWAINVVDQVA